MAIRVAPPAEPLICSLLIGGHGVHQLQAGAMMMTTQEVATAPVNAAHSLQSSKKIIAYVCILHVKRCEHTAM